ncbi:hypothetical protein AAFF_G00086960, partial [Aldrovandia affinis]
MNALARHRRITSLARLPCRRIRMGVATRTGAAEPRGRAEEAEDREGGIDHDHASVRGSGCSTVTAEGLMFIGFITPSVAGRPAEAPIRTHPTPTLRMPFRWSVKPHEPQG